ncbi:otoferlin [Caerostris extrusa]|uniref:Otoferlin n=1 Tax=Caerostris extrusa TaxID=172846 RepID=A0AAV4NFI4_CAEEX|nr:otoferlin [Caerostris extrusa]
MIDSINHFQSVLFWGLRVERVHLMTVDRPRVDIECAGHILQSSIILNYKKNPNFSTPVKHFDVELPDQEMYCPPLTIRVMDCRSFGRFTLVGTHVINSLQKYVFRPLTKKESNMSRYSSNQMLMVQTDEVIIDIDGASPMAPKETLIILDFGGKQKKDQKTEANKKKKNQTEEENFDDDEENKDWWTRYFASYEAMIKEKSQVTTDSVSSLGAINGDANVCSDEGGEELSLKETRKVEKEIQRLENQHQPPQHQKENFERNVDSCQTGPATVAKIYNCELENVLEFGGFREWLHSFELFRGKRTGDELEDQNRTVGVFKGSLKVYKTPLPKDIQDPYLNITDPQAGLFQGLPSNEPIHVLVRVYIVKATDLHPADLNGKADPYIVINLGSKKTNDKENYISKQLNPVFGKCFEFEATFPQDSLLNVQIYDWDLLGSDDLIGETKIDLENRFYSRHRPTCGLAQKYSISGPNQWRDPLKPTQILAKLCKDLKLDGPYIMHNRIRIGNKAFTFQTDGDTDGEYSRASSAPITLPPIRSWHTEMNVLVDI